MSLNELIVAGLVQDKILDVGCLKFSQYNNVISICSLPLARDSSNCKTVMIKEQPSPGEHI